MHSLFFQLGFHPSSDRNTGHTVRLVYICNPDGTVRWVCPANARQALFLKFYAVHTFRAAVFATLAQLVFRLRLQTLVFRTTTLHLHKQGGLFNPLDHRWAIFTGTPGPNNTVLIYTQTTGKPQFIKVPTTPEATVVMRREAEALAWLETVQWESFQAPRLYAVHPNALAVEDLSVGGKRDAHLTAMHLAALYEIAAKTGGYQPLSAISGGSSFSARLEAVAARHDARLPQGMLKKLALLAEISGDATIETTAAHGDFTPWNMYRRAGMLAVYDWELFHPHLPAGYDAFHFILQKGILSARKSWKDIRAEIESTLPEAVFLGLSPFGKTSRDTSLGHYLLVQVTTSLELYSLQQQWHPQIHWLLGTWNEALSDLLQPHLAPRSLLLLDIFDAIAPHPYAAVKFPDNAPEELSVYSDVDLCVSPQASQALESLLKRHPLIARYQSIKQSFMRSFQVVLTDGSVLCLDAIRDFRRKSLVLVSAQKVLKTAKVNAFGVRVMDPVLQARYIGLFYGLNHARVPERLQQHAQVLADSSRELDRLLHHALQGHAVDARKLIRNLGYLRENWGWSRLRRIIAYGIDALRSVTVRRGLVITFSGVDGAGKSTVIRHMQHELEKRFRRKVVVLRHRPSLLPILSAWVKGKAQAEQEAATRLPRQGQNRSGISSALRFGYYYLDYLIGQFYVWFRYTLRGVVVLYDRYYFDFMADSRRSNIALPGGLAAAGYALLLKPDANFFLYADAATILARKQELPAADIEELTLRYKTLFSSLNGRAGRSPKYYVIENTDLSRTVSNILQTLLPTAI